MTKPLIPDPLLRAALFGASCVVLAAGMKAAAPLVNAVLLAMLLALTLLPAKQALVRRGLSRPMAVLLVLVGVVAGGVLLVGALVSAIADFTSQAPVYQQHLADAMTRVEQFLAERDIDVSAFTPSAAQIIDLAQGLVGGVLATLGWSVLGLLLIALLLLEMPLPQAGAADEHLAGIYSTVQRYMTINGAVAGAAAAANLVAMLIAGTDHALLWAVLSFLLAFVPFGFLVAVLPPMALTAFESGGTSALVLGLVFVTINAVADNVIKPKFMGDGLGIPLSAIVLSFLAWGFILGPFGALLAVPLTLALIKAAPMLGGGRA